jgi:hypothetical protein
MKLSYDKVGAVHGSIIQINIRPLRSEKMENKRQTMIIRMIFKVKNKKIEHRTEQTSRVRNSL